MSYTVHKQFFIVKSLFDFALHYIRTVPSGQSKLTSRSAMATRPPGCLALLEILEIHWKFSSLVCQFARLSLILVTIFGVY